MGDRYVKSDEKKMIFYKDATRFNGLSMSQPLPFDEIEMWHGNQDLHRSKLEKISNKVDDSDIGCFVEVDLKYPDETKEETKHFPFVHEKNVIPKDETDDYMKKRKPKNYTKTKKIIM